MKRGFTLIELIVVIAILGILAAIIVPNISNVQGKATSASIQSNARNLQTSVDMYALDHNGQLPSAGEVSIGLPQKIDYSLLQPEYTRNVPKSNKGKYWIDYTGTVWYSQVDSPINVDNDGTTLKWDKVDGAASYEIYKEVSTTGAVNNGKILKVVGTTTDLSFPTGNADVYYVGSVDSDGFKSPPVGNGYNPYGEVIGGSNNPQQAFTPIQIIGSSSSIYAILNNNSFKFWGSYVNGDGTGSFGSKYQTSPLELVDLNNAKELYTRSTASMAVMNDGTVKQWTGSSMVVTSINGLNNVKKLSMGGGHYLALLNDGTVKGWGDNTYHQLTTDSQINVITPITISGISNVKDILAGTYSSYVLLNDGTLRYWGNIPNYTLSTDSVVPVPTTVLTGVKEITASKYGVVALMQNGTVRTIGGSSYFSGSAEHSSDLDPTIVTDLSNVKKIYSHWDYDRVFAVLNDGTVKAWGYNYDVGALGDGTTTNQSLPVVVQGLSNVKEISLGATHNLALLNDGTVKTWGNNGKGQLGLGTTDVTLIPTTIPNLSNISKVFAVYSSSMAIGKDGKVYSWGSNQNGLVGLGTTQTAVPFYSTPQLLEFK